MTTNKNDSNKAAVLVRLDALRAALKREPPRPAISQALDQCDRLEAAITQFHAEGLRFATFTLLRLMQQMGTQPDQPVHMATQELKAAIEAAGFPH